MKTKSSIKPIFLLLLMLGTLWWSGCGDCPPWQRDLPFPEKEDFKPSIRKLYSYKKIDSFTIKTTKSDGKETKETEYKMYKVKSDTFYDCNRNGEPCGNCMSSGVKFVNYHYENNLKTYRIIIRLTAAKEQGPAAFYFTDGIRMVFRNHGDSFYIPSSYLVRERHKWDEESFSISAFDMHLGRGVKYSFQDGFIKGNFIYNSGTWEILK